MVTVEADAVCVESRLAAGRIECPSCGGGRLARWGWARRRSVIGVGAPIRPRRGRCRGCGATHVLLPVVLLLRRGYSAVVVFSALVARATGLGHRRVAGRVGVPASTVRRWLARAAGRLDTARAWFLGAAVAAGIDVDIPAASTAWAGLVAAIETARAAIEARFAADHRVVEVTGPVVAVAVSGGRLLSPGWPDTTGGAGPTPVASDVIGGG